MTTLAPDRESVRLRAAAWAKMYIRSREQTKFHGMSFKVFRAPCFTRYRRCFASPRHLPRVIKRQRRQFSRSPHYRIDSILHPCGLVGGDWLGGDLLDDNTVWILVADVCGKGYAASILARGLPLLWRIRSARDLRGQKCEPVELLDLLGRELNRCLPNGGFVEATAARLDPSGQVSAARQA